MRKLHALSILNSKFSLISRVQKGQHCEKMEGDEFQQEENQEEHDKEWEDFAKLLEKKKRNSTQIFYPCPPPEDVDEYVQTLVCMLIAHTRE